MVQVSRSRPNRPFRLTVGRLRLSLYGLSFFILILSLFLAIRIDDSGEKSSAENLKKQFIERRITVEEAERIPPPIPEPLTNEIEPAVSYPVEPSRSKAFKNEDREPPPELKKEAEALRKLIGELKSEARQPPDEHREDESQLLAKDGDRRSKGGTKDEPAQVVKADESTHAEMHSQQLVSEAEQSPHEEKNDEPAQAAVQPVTVAAVHSQQLASDAEQPPQEEKKDEPAQAAVQPVEEGVTVATPLWSEEVNKPSDWHQAAMQFKTASETEQVADKQANQEPLPVDQQSKIEAEEVNTNTESQPENEPVAEGVETAKTVEEPMQQIKDDKTAAAKQDEPTIFLIVADSRSGSDWIQSRLDLHPAVCAAGETGGINGEGFPLGALLPDGMPWLDDSDTRQGCTLAFVRKGVLELLESSTVDESGTWVLPNRCNPDYNADGDRLRMHLPRFCRFAKLVQETEKYDKNDRAGTEILITHQFMRAFQENDQELLACRCHETTQVRGMKIISEWQTRIPGFLDQHDGVKVIRLRRRNVFARYMSLQTAMATNIWQTHTAEEKRRQLDAVPSNWNVDVDAMLEQFAFMNDVDATADNWAKEHARTDSDIMWVEYEDIRDNAATVFQQMFDFLGIRDSQALIDQNGTEFSSTFKGTEVAFASTALKRVANAAVVQEALVWSGFGSLVGVSELKEVRHLQLVGEEDAEYFKSQKSTASKGVRNFVAVLHESGDNSNKFSEAIKVLKEMPEDSLIVASMNSKENAVLTNPKIRSSSAWFSAVSRARGTIEENAGNGIVIVSASTQCCASALSRAFPGDFFEPSPMNEQILQRKKRSCASGTQGCEWAGEYQGLPWRTFMKDTAAKKGKTSENTPVYLDASIMAGKAVDVVKLLEAIDVRGSEDERAVLADYMFQKPDMIALDYDEALVGQEFGSDESLESGKGCFDVNESMSTPRNFEPNRLPLFVRALRDLGCRSKGK